MSYSKKEPLISVIVPVYNTAAYLTRCLDSIINQTYKNLEIILVDDGSTDDSGAICDHYAANDDRITVIHQDNKGVSSARNRGIEIMSGEFVHFPDSDDYIDFDTYDCLMKKYNETNCKVINFEHCITYDDREIVHAYKKSFYGIVDKQEALRRIAGGVQFCCNKLFLSKLITEKPAIRFNEQIHRGEDTLFSASVVDRSDKVLFDNAPFYHYVQSNDSACRGTFRHTQLTAIDLYQAFEPIYGKYPMVWQTFVTYNQHNLINLYYDMWCIKDGLNKEKRVVIDTLREHYVDAMNFEKTIMKEKIKFSIFQISPNLFCLLHKMLHRV